MAARGIIDSIDNLDIMVDDKPVDLSTITKKMITRYSGGIDQG